MLDTLNASTIGLSCALGVGGKSLLTEGEVFSLVGVLSGRGGRAVVINGVGTGRRGERRGSSGVWERDPAGDVDIWSAGDGFDLEGAVNVAEERMVVSCCFGVGVKVAGERVVRLSTFLAANGEPNAIGRRRLLFDIVEKFLGL